MASARALFTKSATYCAFVALVLLLARDASAQSRPRYVGMLADGQIFEGAVLTDWQDTKALPRVDGRPLAEPNNHFTWLRDRTLALPETPPAYLEMHTGDRLPGNIVGYSNSSEHPWDPAGDYFIVRPSITLVPPENKPAGTIRVKAPAVKRIVWQRRAGDAARPGELHLRDGRTLAFRAARFGDGTVNLLAAEGSSKIVWQDIAEITLPTRDYWKEYFDELALLTPNGTSRLLQIEALGGLIATTSLERYYPRGEGNSGESHRWVHGIQPAWALDLLWVPSRDIVLRQSFLPHEMLVARVPFSSERLASSTLSGSPPRIGRSSSGEELASTTRLVGTGIGMTSGWKLTFELPPISATLRGNLAIDRSSGTGGCLQGFVRRAGLVAKDLWKSEVIVGSSQVSDFRDLPLEVAGDLSGARPKNELIFEVDPVHQSRPAGADPLDIRDRANWGDLVLTFDKAKVNEQIAARIPLQFAAYEGWEVILPSGIPAIEKIEVEVSYDYQAPSPHRLQTSIGLRGETLLFRKTMRLSPSDQWLMIGVTRPQARGTDPMIEVRLAGEIVGELRVPQRQMHESAADFKPLIVSLATVQRGAGGAVPIELRLITSAESPPMHFRSITTVSQLPTLYRGLEEKVTIESTSDTGAASAAFTDAETYYGSTSLQIAPGTRATWPLEGMIEIRERPEWGQYRFARFAVKKRGGGHAALEILTRDNRPVPACFLIGPGKSTFENSPRVWNDRLPEHWVVITRDLYADFGSCEITGLAATAVEGETLWIDHIYFARRHDDFDLLPQAPTPEQVNRKAREELSLNLMQRVWPAMAWIETAEGVRQGAAMINNNGWLITSAHALSGQTGTVKVHLTTGSYAGPEPMGEKVLEGEIRGTSRSMNATIIKLKVTEQQFPTIGMWNSADLQFDRPCLSANWPRATDAMAKITPEVVQLRRAYRSSLWIDRNDMQQAIGSPLLSTDGQIIGLAARQSPYGGMLYTRVHWGTIESQLAKLVEGTSFGNWSPGMEPELGLEAEVTPAGMAVKSLAKGSAAAAQGIAIGDVLLRIDGSAITSLETLQTAISEKDAGNEVTIDFQHASETKQTRVKLAPRK